MRCYGSNITMNLIRFYWHNTFSLYLIVEIVSKQLRSNKQENNSVNIAKLINILKELYRKQ